MSTLDAIVVGVVQGLTEFLPVSSSGHLVVTKFFYGARGVSASYIILLHVGTLVAVVAALWRDIVAILKEVVTGEGSGRAIAIAVIISTIPGALFGFFVAGALDRIFCETGLTLGNIPLEPYKFVGAAFIATACFFLRGADRIIRQREETKTHGAGPEGLTWQVALKIGLAQALAIIPGISRSGATIATGLRCGLSRDFAARFSFLMAIPIILGGLLHELPKLNMTLQYPGEDLRPMIIGVVVAAVTGYAAVRYMLRLLVTKDMRAFVVYLWVVGLICIAS